MSERRFRDIQIVIITNFIVISSVGIKSIDYNTILKHVIIKV